MSASPEHPPLARLLSIMARLRDPDSGCEWDLAQDFASIAPYTIEEAYEVADAIQRGDMMDLRDELGDLLLQVVFHARMAEEAGHFAFNDVAAAIATRWKRAIRTSSLVLAEPWTKPAGKISRPRNALPRALPALSMALPLRFRH